MMPAPQGGRGLQASCKRAGLVVGRQVGRARFAMRAVLRTFILNFVSRKSGAQALWQRIIIHANR